MEVMSSGCCRGSERRWHCDGQTGLESRRVFVRVTAHLRIHQDANGCVREGGKGFTQGLRSGRYRFSWGGVKSTRAFTGLKPWAADRGVAAVLDGSWCQ